jgi:uncharacterized protein YbjT (DUF2867 family)
MRLAVVGGKGTVGKYVVSEAEAVGHQVRVLSRRTGVNIESGLGLADALDGVDAIVDAANPDSLGRRKASAFFATCTANLHEAGTRAGVGHLVTVSIVGIDKVPGFGYYQAKLVHEAAALAGSLPATIVRATQFHEFAGQILLRTRQGRLAALPRMKVQTVAARTVGHFVVEAAFAPGAGQTLEVAGPEVADLVDRGRAFLLARHVKASVLPLPIPGSAGRALRSGAILATDRTKILGPTFDEWLESDDAAAVGC